jgi:NAD(P)-dependent dehydrogenase (short-subunit alcohol dehydrogenase family)
MAGQSFFQPGDWALVLGASSGFGAATSIELARAGLDIFGVHLDRRATLPNAQRVQEEIASLGRRAVFFNVNAADEEKRKHVLGSIKQQLDENGGMVRVLLHSLAFGSLGPYMSGQETGDRGQGAAPLTRQQIEMTLDVMANSLVYWVRDLVDMGLMGEGGRVLALTSAGGHKVWPAYGAVSAAKAALESHVRQLALELAPRSITVNAIRAGVTDTPALRKIPGSEEMLRRAQQLNPHGRAGTPEDVARAIAVLSHPNTYWITGNVIGVDGGEDITG